MGLGACAGAVISAARQGRTRGSWKPLVGVAVFPQRSVSGSFLSNNSVRNFITLFRFPHLPKIISLMSFISKVFYQHVMLILFAENLVNRCSIIFLSFITTPCNVA